MAPICPRVGLEGAYLEVIMGVNVRQDAADQSSGHFYEVIRVGASAGGGFQVIPSGLADAYNRCFPGWGSRGEWNMGKCRDISMLACT